MGDSYTAEALQMPMIKQELFTTTPFMIVIPKVALLPNTGLTSVMVATSLVPLFYSKPELVAGARKASQFKLRATSGGTHVLFLKQNANSERPRYP